jgi:lantibiotic modifying enzyme
MSPDPLLRPTPLEMLRTVEGSCYFPEPEKSAESDDEPLELIVREICMHINEAASYGRRDRLFPSNPKMFVTNPLSLAYGASGVAYTLQRVIGRVPQAALDWILSHNVTLADYTPGLYIGLSGIALALLEMGVQRQAETIFQMSADHSLLHASPDVFYGIAGWGMANLRFFLQTEDELYLRNAVHAGNHLLQTSKDAPTGRYWQNLNEVHVGYAHGASGIGLFLLYLYLATGDERFLWAGEQGLEFDLNQACETKDGGLSWPDRAGGKSPLYPYWRTGSAGVGTALLRFYRLLGTDRYHSILEKIYIDVDRKYAVLPGLFSGMAGMGEFLLDMHEFSGEHKYFDSARKAAKGIMHFRVERNGIAFPGESLDRLCCDMGTGSAGVALFLNRLLGRNSANFLLDGLFTSKMAQARSSHTASMARS